MVHEPSVHSVHEIAGCTRYVLGFMEVLMVGPRKSIACYDKATQPLKSSIVKLYRAIANDYRLIDSMLKNSFD